eukprot:1135297-Heterocapsa_arctica.AAC.1
MWGTWCPSLASTPPSSRMSQTATCMPTCSIMGYCLLSFMRIHPSTRSSEPERHGAVVDAFHELLEVLQWQLGILVLVHS